MSLKVSAVGFAVGAAVCLAPADALASGVSKPKPPTKPAPAKHAPAKPKPATASAPEATLSGSGLFSVGTRYRVTIPGRRVRISGVIKPWVTGQHYTLTAYDGKRVFLRRAVSLTGTKNGARFSTTLAAPGAGTVTVRLTHKSTPTLHGFSAETHFDALADKAGPGAHGPFIKLIQQRLWALHIWLPQSGVFDQGTGLALDTYHRLLHQGFSESLDQPTVNSLLAGNGAFKLRFPRQGRHAEGNLSDQVLALADGSKVKELFPISSGKPSTPTVLGSYRIYQRTPGTLPDGMYYSSFFTGGYAIHGYNPAPDYPASHGCMRLPIPDAVAAYDWLAMGDWVDVYH
ncbi:MAG: L,D-transpeptidase [Solirubrobacterales bacterium]|nr:L,D-transpeptidase [Solirubrobacterales bacterium]